MSILTVIINYQTPDLLTVAVRSFKNIYPQESLLIVDNGSKDDSRSVIENLLGEYHNVESLYLDTNIFHGPTMHHVLSLYTDVEYIFFLDSDTVTKKKGFLEEMRKLADENDKVYAIGQRVMVNKRGFKSAKGFPLILTPYLFLKTSVYTHYSPFIHHGQPTLNNFFEAVKDGYILVDYPITDYIDHLWRGTANRFGYGLGIKSKIDYLLNKLGI